MKKIASLLTFLLLFTIYELNAQDAEKPNDFSYLIGQIVKSFDAKTLNGKPFSLSDYEGKYIMLLFWSKSCGGCNKELPDLNRIIEERKHSDFVLLSVMDDTAEELRDPKSMLQVLYNTNGYYKYLKPVFYNDLIDFEIIPDGLKYRELFKIPKMSPFTLFIDKDFIIRDVNVGYYAYGNYEKLNLKVTELMKK
jgi:thiol-disulfide isomerase/thioredoxin